MDNNKPKMFWRIAFAWFGFMQLFFDVAFVLAIIVVLARVLCSFGFIGGCPAQMIEPLDASFGYSAALLLSTTFLFVFGVRRIFFPALKVYSERNQ